MSYEDLGCNVLLGGDLWELKMSVACYAAGIGSGFCVEHSDGSPVNLITLYSTYKAEREQLNVPAQHINRLLAPRSREDGSSNHSQLTSPVGELCGVADAFMLVVDATAGPSKGSCLLNSEWNVCSCRL